MSLELLDIDHLMIRVADLDAAAATFTALGFTVTPPRRHIAADALAGAAGGAASEGGKAGINNRHVLFEPFPGRRDIANFLEFMCIEDQMALPPAVTQMLGFLLDSQGPRTVVCYSPDLARTCAAMERAGIAFSSPIPFETGWQDSERDTFVRIHAAPSVPVFGQIPFQINPYETDTLEEYRYGPWVKHANGARFMAGVFGVTERIEEHVAYMAETVFGVEPEWESPESAVITPRDLYFRILTSAGFRTRYPGLDFSNERVLPFTAGATIAVDSLDTVRGLLGRNSIPWQDTTDGIAVARRHAANTIIEFIPGRH